MLQAQEHITALHNVCQQLESSATGKAAEARLQKALDKLHKIQQATLSAASGSTGHGTKTEQAINLEQQTAAGPQSGELVVREGKMGNSAVSPQPDSVSEPVSSHHSNGEDAVMADAVALHDACPAADEHSDVIPGQDKVDGASVQNLEHAKAAADKCNTAAEKKAEKEKAKVGLSHPMQANGIRTCMFSLAWIQKSESLPLCCGCNFGSEGMKTTK